MSSHALPGTCRPTLATVERGRRRLTDGERTQLAIAARYARHTGTPSMKELARAWKISPQSLYDIINRQRETGSAAALRRTGPAYLLGDADETVLAELSEELDGEYTWEEITERFNEKTGKNVSTMTVYRFCKNRGWRDVCDKYVRSWRGQTSKCGEWYEVDCEVKGEMFRRMVQTQLTPDIQRKLLRCDRVYVQMDGARAHVKFWEDLKELGARRRQIDGQKTPVIRFVRQPANSPDTNVLNLCFFRSLVKLVSFFEERKEVQTRLWRQGSIFEACHADFPRLSRQRDDGQLLKDEEHRRPTDHWRTKDERLRASARLHRVETNSSRTQRRFERRRRALGTNTVLRRRPRSASLCTQSRPLMMALMRRQDDRTIRYVNLQGPELISKSWEARALQTPPESRTSDRSLRSNSFHDNQMFKWHL